MVEFRNGMRDPYGIMPPDPDQDTYGATQPRPEVGWVAGGQTPTNSATPQQPQFIQKPNDSNYPPPSVQNNQPLPTTPSRPELKVPSTADYIFEGLANALRGRASGAVFGALAAKGRHIQAQNALTEKQREFDMQEQDRRARLAVPNANEIKQRDKAQILADPEVQKYRTMSGLPTNAMTDAEYNAGAAKQMTEATEGIKQPGRLAQIQARQDAKAQPQVSREVKTTATGETVTYDPKGNTWLDSRGRPMASAPRLGSIVGGGAAGSAADDIHLTAQALVDANRGDPTAVSTLKQLGGFGNKKIQVFAEARRIDPTFNASKGDRMAKTVENFTTATTPGSGNMQLRSLGTFVQHTSDLQSAAEELKRTDSQLLNRPLSWVQQQITSDPKYAAFQAALMAPTMEYLRLLNNGGAPYEQERKDMANMLPPTATVGQVIGATREMGQVVSKRANALNSEFKRGTGGHDMWKTLPDALPPEAHEAAKRLGITFGDGGGQPTQPGQAPTQPGQGAPAGQPQLKPNFRYRINGKEVTTDANGNIVGQ